MGRAPRDGRLRAVLRERAAIRAEYADVLEAQVSAAEHATRGNLLGERAPSWAKPEDLWLRNEATAYAWAAEELRVHWRSTTRLTWGAYQSARLPYGQPCDRDWGSLLAERWQDL